MKHTKHHHELLPPPATPAPAGAARPTAADLPRGAAGFTPAYFTYVNQGSQSGHEVQHWLKAEADLIAERNLTRIHGYHNPT